MKVPIACTLTPEGAADRVEEWRLALGDAVTHISRPEPTRLVMRVGSDAARIANLVELARREKGCCEFFGFAFHVGADDVTFEISVPEEAIAVLDGFAEHPSW
jgi:predicted amidohydrolase